MDGQYVKIGYIDQLLAANPHIKRDVLMDAIAERIEFYRDQAKAPMTGPLDYRLGVTQGFYDAVDEEIKKMEPNLKAQIKCKKGCAHCCKIRVEVSLSEAQYVLHTCKENNIPLDIDYLKNQAKLKENNDYLLSPFRRCALLGPDDTCSVYEVRPMSCRSYFVISDPDLCDYGKGTAQVTVVHQLNPTLMAAGLMAADSDSGSFPDMLLKAIELDKQSSR